MIGYAIYTTEGVPLYNRGNISDPELVSFIDKYGIWVLYAPGIRNGRQVCYIGARFDNVKETILGRLNRVVLLVVLEKPEEFQNSWKLFKKESIVKLAEESGLIFDEELRISKFLEERLQEESLEESKKEISRKVSELIREIRYNGDSLTIPSTKVRDTIHISGFTDVTYPSLKHRQYFIKGVTEGIRDAEGITCAPKAIAEFLKSSWGNEEEKAYPLVIYSKGRTPYLLALWFSGG